MASTSEPRIYALKAEGAISKGMIVKASTADANHAAKASAATQKLIGVCQSDPTAAEDFMEVAFPGGGGKFLLGGTVAFGDLLTSDAAGKAVATTTANDRVVGVAYADGVAGDLIPGEVQISNF